jgi:lipoprotein NlpI
LADANAALKLQGDDENALDVRGRIYLCLDEPKLAESDYSGLIARDGPAAYRGRALARWQAGNFAGAVSDLEQLVKAAPEYVYGVLLLETMRVRAGTLDPSTAREDMSSVETRDWPRPIFDLYLGKIGTDDVFSAAAEGEPEKVKGRKCEARFYVAEWMLAHQQGGAAKPLLQAARNDCPRRFFEYDAAKIELGQLR